MNHENIFGVVGRAQCKLVDAGMRDHAVELTSRVWDCKSYKEARELVDDYLSAIPGMTEAEADAEWDKYWEEVNDVS